MSPEQILTLIIALPGIAFLGLGLIWLVGGRVPERALARLTSATYSILVLLLVWLAVQMWQAGTPSLQVSLGDWFTVGHYGFQISLVADRLSLPVALGAALLAGLVGLFSVRYLHRDPGFQRFFLLLHLFTFGALMIFMAGSLDLLIVGWELVGITSVLLISFFQYRPDPARNALRVFGTYRVADLGLLVAAFLAHHWFGTASWSGLFAGQWPGYETHVNGQAASVIAVLLVFAAAGKSAQGPFCGWLARAMEGPTPSSAIFYGAISVHAGAYLLLRMEPLIHASWVASSLLVFMGLTTAFLGTMVHRTCADAKTSLAYASQTQLGIIFAEIGLGWTTLAVIHIISHAVVRTMQFLRTPSMLRDHHRVHAASGGRLDTTGDHYEALLPRGVQVALYRIALGRGFYDAVVDRFLIAPVKILAGWLGIFEPAWGKSQKVSKAPAHPALLTGHLTAPLTKPTATTDS